jgi:HEAT repeat protein
MLRDMLQSNDPVQVRQACRAAVCFHEFEVIPTLIAVLEESGNRFADEAAAALTQLADVLVHELATLRDERRRRDPTIARRNATVALEQSVSRWPKHQRREPLEAFLQLANRDNAALYRLLTDSRDPCYAPLCEVLLNSDRPGVVRLLLHFLDDSRPPNAALQALFRRTDRRMIEAVLKKVGIEPSPVVRANLRRVDHIAWAADESWTVELDDVSQQAFVTAITASGMKRGEVFAVLTRFAKQGRPGGRRAAIAALPEFNTTEADILLLRALDDDEPEVRAAALVQLRPRGIPGALATLLDSLDAPAAAVREAARSQLQEFTFRRYLPAFDLLADDVRRTTGKLVAKIDLSSPGQLREELRSSQPKRRARAIEVAEAMGLAEHLEDDLVECLGDSDHVIRAEAARALAGTNSDEARVVLQQLLDDASFAVREAAQTALEHPRRPTAAEVNHGV